MDFAISAPTGAGCGLEHELYAAEKLLHLVVLLCFNGLAVEVLRRKYNILERRIVRTDLKPLRTDECAVVRCKD